MQYGRWSATSNFREENRPMANSNTLRVIKTKKPFRKGRRVMVTDPYSAIALRIGEVIKCRGRLEKMVVDGETVRQRVFTVSAQFDGIDEPITIEAEDVKYIATLCNDDLIGIAQQTIELQCSRKTREIDMYAESVNETINRLRDDIELEQRIMANADQPILPIPREDDVQEYDRSIRLGYGDGVNESEWPCINVYASATRYNSEVRISFTGMTCTAAEALAYARQLHAAALKAIELRTQTIEKLTAMSEQYAASKAAIETDTHESLSYFATAE